jgi:uncharacterized repeat protein (TIGR03803 family)
MDFDAAVFRITPGGTFTQLVGLGYAANPLGGLVQGTDGDLYGTTSSTGDFSCGENEGCGTVFKVTREGPLTTLHAFNGSDGNHPFAGLVQGSDDNFYGTTLAGGANGRGTVFKMSPQGTLITLHSFAGSDGSSPQSTLVQATDGNFYGTASVGGVYGDGTIFEITSAGTLTTLHSFDANDGANPQGGLFQDTNGRLYGTTSLGGAHNDGTIFSLDVGLAPFISLLRYSGTVGSPMGILGQGFTGTTSVSVNGTSATFTVVSDTYLTAKVPSGATTGFVTVTTPSGTLTSNQQFRVKP